MVNVVVSLVILAEPYIQTWYLVQTKPNKGWLAGLHGARHTGNTGNGTMCASRHGHTRAGRHGHTRAGRYGHIRAGRHKHIRAERHSVSSVAPHCVERRDDDESRDDPESRRCSACGSAWARQLSGAMA
eukprot:351382-Chlamydomonas_euryale.AAC.7